MEFLESVHESTSFSPDGETTVTYRFPIEVGEEEHQIPRAYADLLCEANPEGFRIVDVESEEEEQSEDEVQTSEVDSQPSTPRRRRKQS